MDSLNSSYDLVLSQNKTWCLSLCLRLNSLSSRYYAYNHSKKLKKFIYLKKYLVGLFGSRFYE